MQRTAAIDPHVSLLAAGNFRVIDPHDFYRSLIGMDDFTVIDQFMHAIVDEGKIQIGTFDYPVCHGIRCKIDSVHLIGF